MLQNPFLLVCYRFQLFKFFKYVSLRIIFMSIYRIVRTVSHPKWDHLSMSSWCQFYGRLLIPFQRASSSFSDLISRCAEMNSCDRCVELRRQIDVGGRARRTDGFRLTACRRSDFPSIEDKPFDRFPALLTANSNYGVNRDVIRQIISGIR